MANGSAWPATSVFKAAEFASRLEEVKTDSAVAPLPRQPPLVAAASGAKPRLPPITTPCDEVQVPGPVSNA